MTWNNFSDIEELNEELVYLNYGIILLLLLL